MNSCYSFVLGDLHAHVVDIMFVLLILALLYAWMKKVRTTKITLENTEKKEFWRRQLLMPQLLAAAALLGMSTGQTIGILSFIIQ